MAAAINAVLAIIADGEVSDCCNLQRGSRNKIISHFFIKNPSMVASSNPFERGSRGWGVFIYGNHAARRENGTS